MRAAIYTRISDDRGGLGLGVTRQLDDCRALAEREGWQVVAELSDNDVSAYTGKRRPGFEALREHIAAGEVDVVVVWHVDRLYRRPKELERLIDLVESAGVLVATITSGDFNLSTANGRAMARVGVAIASHESDHKSERIRRKMLELAEAGRPAGGGARPYGFDRDGVTIVAAEADLIREAATRLLAGEPVRAILADWTARGIESPSGGQWRHGSFVRVMQRWRNCGVREHYGEPKGEGQWPAILDRETVERLRAMLTDPARRPPRAPQSYMLRGLLTCGREGCGALLISKPRAGSRRAYSCAKGPALPGCGRLSALADPLEDEVVGRVAARLAGQGLATAIEQLQASSDDTDDDGAGELVQLRSRLDELSADYYEHGLVAKSEYLSRRDGIERRIAALEERMARTTGAGVLAQLPADEAAIAGAFATRDTAWCRAVLGAVLVRVVLLPSKGGSRFRPERVVCEWKV